MTTEEAIVKFIEEHAPAKEEIITLTEEVDDLMPTDVFMEQNTRYYAHMV